jgi:hypothetical protein
VRDENKEEACFFSAFETEKEACFFSAFLKLTR